MWRASLEAPGNAQSWLPSFAITAFISLILKFTAQRKLTGYARFMGQRRGEKAVGSPEPRVDWLSAAGSQPTLTSPAASWTEAASGKRRWEGKSPVSGSHWDKTRLCTSSFMCPLTCSFIPHCLWVLCVQARGCHMLPGMGSDKTDEARTQQCRQTRLFSECQRHHAMEPRGKPQASPEWLTGTGFCVIPAEVWEQNLSCFMVQALFSGLKTLKYSWWITAC